MHFLNKKIPFGSYRNYETHYCERKVEGEKYINKMGVGSRGCLATELP